MCEQRPCAAESRERGGGRGNTVALLVVFRKVHVFRSQSGRALDPANGFKHEDMASRCPFLRPCGEPGGSGKVSSGRPRPVGTASGGTGTSPRWAGCSVPIPSNRRCPGSSFGMGEGITTRAATRWRGRDPGTSFFAVGVSLPCCPFPRPADCCSLPVPSPPLRLQVELLFSSFPLLSQHLS